MASYTLSKKEVYRPYLWLWLIMYTALSLEGASVPLVCLLYHRVGVYKDDCMSSHAFSRNLWLVNEEVASYYADIGVASDEVSKR